MNHIPNPSQRLVYALTGWTELPLCTSLHHHGDPGDPIYRIEKARTFALDRQQHPHPAEVAPEYEGTDIDDNAHCAHFPHAWEDIPY